MAILKNCEIWFAKLDPKRPNNRFNKENPTWECQIRTTSKEQKKEWESYSLPVKAVVPDEGEPYFRVNLRKKSIKSDGDKASSVAVVDGNLEDINPNTIGNGSVGNIRIYQYEYPKQGGGTGITSVLMGVQVTKLIKFTPRPRDDDFEPEEMEVVEPEAADDEEFETAASSVKI